MKNQSIKIMQHCSYFGCFLIFHAKQLFQSDDMSTSYCSCQLLTIPRVSPVPKCIETNYEGAFLRGFFECQMVPQEFESAGTQSNTSLDISSDLLPTHYYESHIHSCRKLGTRQTVDIIKSSKNCKVQIYKSRRYPPYNFLSNS